MADDDWINWYKWIRPLVGFAGILTVSIFSARRRRVREARLRDEEERERILKLMAEEKKDEFLDMRLKEREKRIQRKKELSRHSTPSYNNNNNNNPHPTINHHHTASSQDENSHRAHSHPEYYQQYAAQPATTIPAHPNRDSTTQAPSMVNFLPTASNFRFQTVISTPTPPSQTSASSQPPSQDATPQHECKYTTTGQRRLLTPYFYRVLPPQTFSSSLLSSTEANRFATRYNASAHQNSPIPAQTQIVRQLRFQNSPSLLHPPSTQNHPTSTNEALSTDLIGQEQKDVSSTEEKKEHRSMLAVVQQGVKHTLDRVLPVGETNALMPDLSAFYGLLLLLLGIFCLFNTVDSLQAYIPAPLMALYCQRYLVTQSHDTSPSSSAPGPKQPSSKHDSVDHDEKRQQISHDNDRDTSSSPPLSNHSNNPYRSDLSIAAPSDPDQKYSKQPEAYPNNHNISTENYALNSQHPVSVRRLLPHPEFLHTLAQDYDLMLPSSMEVLACVPFGASSYSNQPSSLAPTLLAASSASLGSSLARATLLGPLLARRTITGTESKEYQFPPFDLARAVQSRGRMEVAELEMFSDSFQSGSLQLAIDLPFSLHAVLDALCILKEPDNVTIMNQGELGGTGVYSYELRDRWYNPNTHEIYMERGLLEHDSSPVPLQEQSDPSFPSSSFTQPASIQGQSQTLPLRSPMTGAGKGGVSLLMKKALGLGAESENKLNQWLEKVVVELPGSTEEVQGQYTSIPDLIVRLERCNKYYRQRIVLTLQEEFRPHPTDPSRCYCVSTGTVAIDPECPSAHNVKKWGKKALRKAQRRHLRYVLLTLTERYGAKATRSNN